MHIGVDPAFTPAAKAHPALRVRDLIGLLDATGIEAVFNDEIVGVTRCHIADPFGNRIELIDVGDR